MTEAERIKELEQDMAQAQAALGHLFMLAWAGRERMTSTQQRLLDEAADSHLIMTAPVQRPRRESPPEGEGDA